jgi:hypothetical protein
MGIIGLKSIIASAQPVSLMIKILRQGWPFEGNAFNDEDFKASSVLCVGSNEPSVQTAWAVRLTASLSGTVR